MPTKLGPHFLVSLDVNATRQIVSTWQPAVMKSFGTQGSIANLDPFADVVPNAKLVHRYWWDEPTTPDDYAGWQAGYGANSVEQWMSRFSSDFQRASGNPRLYIESFNEVGMSDDYLRFEAQRVRLLAERYGLKSAVINAAVGTTTLQDWQRAQNAGLLDALRDTGSVIGVHNYAGFFMTLWHGGRNLGDSFNDLQLKEPPKNLVFRPLIPYEDPEGVDSWLAFRVRQDHEHLKNLGYADVRFILTEFGIDDAGFPTYQHYTNGRAHGGWRAWIDTWYAQGFLDNVSPEEFYVDQLRWADKQLQLYPFVDGAALFAYHADPGSLWQQYDIYGSVTQLLVQKTVSDAPIRTSFADYGDTVAAVQEPPPPPAEPTPSPLPTIPPGPGPIHSAPMYHFMILPSEQERQWFFNSIGARRYWQIFQPVLLSIEDLGYIEFLSQDDSLMVTLVGEVGMLNSIIQQISTRWIYVSVDPVPVSSANQIDEIFASRAAANLRF